MDLASEFEDIFGVQPYGRFQIEPAENLLNGKSVILQAPTGSGKTRAAIFPYLLARKNGLEFPGKMLYCVPLRVLARSFHEEMRNAGYGNLDIRLQTGEQQDDRQLEGQVVFTTIDQVLSSFLLSPYSLPRRLSNLNAGAVTSSYLVLDEFHLFDPVATLPTVLEMLRVLRGVSPFLLMTATFSAKMLEGLAEALGAIIVPSRDADRQEMLKIPPQQKTRRYHLEEGPLCADVILERHCGRSLVVCNVVDRAQAIFEALRNHPKRGDIQVRLLHSRFLPEDRQRIEDEILRHFGRKGNRSGSWIVVATQVIEVGLDITCQTLHTELAPANAILQRAGRCARYEGEEGDVYVYLTFRDKEETIDLREKTAPYKDEKEEIARTAGAFGRPSDSDALNYEDELSVVSFAHGPTDSRTLDGLVATQETHRRRMNEVMDGQGNGAGSLIRSVSSRLVVVHDNPNLLLERPFAAESFAVHPSSLYGLVGRWLEREKGLELESWGIYALQDRGDVDEGGVSSYKWLPVRSPADVAGAVLVLVHPQLAGYDKEMGFLPDRPTGYQAAIAPVEPVDAHAEYAYCLETYVEHVGKVYQVFVNDIWTELAHAAARLEQVCNWPKGIVEQAAHLVVLLHDVGKLNQAWQKWVRCYQEAVGSPVEDGFYAHTNYNPADPVHRAAQEKLGRKPSHAVEGAVAVAPLLAAKMQQCEALFKAAFTAIARHHGAFTRQGQCYKLASGAKQVVAKTLNLLPQGITEGLTAEGLWTSENATEEKIRDLLIDPAKDDQLLAYGLLARALRRADQAGTAHRDKEVQMCPHST